MTVSRGVRRAVPSWCSSTCEGDEFHQSFAFDLMLSTWKAKPVRTAISESLYELAPSVARWRGR